VNFATIKKTALQFLLKHWKEVLLVLLSVIIFFKMQSDMNELQKAYETAKQSYEQQIQGMQDIHDKELKKREEALRTYREALELLERQYREEQDRIEERTEERRESLEESHSERPQDVIDEIISQFGFEYVE